MQSCICPHVFLVAGTFPQPFLRILFCPAFAMPAPGCQMGGFLHFLKGTGAVCDCFFDICLCYFKTRAYVLILSHHSTREGAA